MNFETSMETMASPSKMTLINSLTPDDDNDDGDDDDDNDEMD